MYLVDIQAVIKQHSRVVSALCLDTAGSRFLAGSYDYTVKLFDFGGMSKEMRPFRSFEPHEGYPIKAVSWSPTGDCFLVVDGSCQPKLYDRDGKELGEFVRGDMYIRDLRNTKGHVRRSAVGHVFANFLRCIVGLLELLDEHTCFFLLLRNRS